jgi:hypothetical protein
MNSKSLGAIRQIGYVVADLDASVRHWTGLVGVGPWSVYKNVTVRGHYRGLKNTVKLNVGLSYQDETQIELIQVMSASPSPYRDSSGRLLIGMNHLGWITDDIDRDLIRARQQGLTDFYEATNASGRSIYLENANEPGLLVELLQSSAATLESFRRGMEASRNWDGVSDPVQVIAFADDTDP